MGTKPKVFIKNVIDIDNPSVTITVFDSEATNDGQSFVDQVRNRNNFTGLATTGSSDSATNYIEIDWIDEVLIDTIILVGHNYKNFTIKKWNGSSFTDFATPISETTNADFVSQFSVTPQNLSKIRIDINATQTVDDEKKIRQIIITRKVGAGQFSGWPEIRKFEKNQNRKAVETLSGKNHLRESAGAAKYQMRFKVWPYDADFIMIEKIYFENPFGVLFWLSGGDETQFRYKRVGYRAEDIFLVKPLNEWDGTFEKSIYVNGMNFDLTLVEVI